MEMLLPILFLVLVTLCLILVLSGERDGEWREQTLSAGIDRLLPQTQCGQCGYPGCMPYADAIARGEAPVNLCPPGGDQTVKYIAEMLGKNFRNIPAETQAVVAFIDEGLCIGCVKCIDACPVDAIIGAPKQMHTVMPKPCTGCGLCLEPCPVDCITLIPAAARIKKWVWTKPRRIFETRL